MSRRMKFSALAAIMGLAVSMLAPMASSDAAAPAAAASASAKKVDARPDRVSAMSTAVLQGTRVEDESQRTPTTATYANPDGTWTTEAYAGVVRFRAGLSSKYLGFDHTENGYSAVEWHVVG